MEILTFGFASAAVFAAVRSVASFALSLEKKSVKRAAWRPHAPPCAELMCTRVVAHSGTRRRPALATVGLNGFPATD